MVVDECEAHTKMSHTNGTMMLSMQMQTMLAMGELTILPHPPAQSRVGHKYAGQHHSGPRFVCVCCFHWLPLLKGDSWESSAKRKERGRLLARYGRRRSSDSRHFFHLWRASRSPACSSTQLKLNLLAQAHWYALGTIGNAHLV